MADIGLTTREDLEAREARDLAPWSCQAAASAGRHWPESEHPLRTCYQRDRDRIIHCSAFRRLEDKTQVFCDVGIGPAHEADEHLSDAGILPAYHADKVMPGPLSDAAHRGQDALVTKSDYTRTRLTHSIEVAQIARTLARALRVNEDLAEAVALAHDLGHAPFGHGGEEVLNKLMAGHGGFEHNRQSLRVVEQLERPYPAFAGLNLTYETRLCLARHQTRYDAPAGDERFPQSQAPLEGQLADLADALAYNSHDLDDALAAGLMSEEDLADIRLYRRVRDKVEAAFPDSHRYVRQLRTAKMLIDELATDALQQTLANLNHLQPRSPEDITAAAAPAAALSAQAAEDLEQLASFLMERVYLHPRILAGTRRAQAMLETLFNYYLTHPEQLPSRYGRRIGDQGCHRVVCDYAAGMTDRYCRREMARLGLL